MTENAIGPQGPEMNVEAKRAEARTAAKPIALDKNLVISPTNYAEFKALVTAVSDGGGFPARFKTLPAKIAAASLATSLMGKRWQLALNNIADIKGQLSIFGELPGSIAELTGQVKEKHVFVIDKDYKEICTENKNLHELPFAGVCKIQRDGRALKEFSYTLEEAKTGGQYPATKWDYDNKRSIPNPDSPWMKFTKIMLMRKAMGMAIKFEFPDALVGCPIAEYDFDSAPDLDGTRDATPTQGLAEQMNSFAEGTDAKETTVQ
jgi:hypothetical protein